MYDNEMMHMYLDKSRNHHGLGYYWDLRSTLHKETTRNSSFPKGTVIIYEQNMNNHRTQSGYLSMKI
jgi:hypothetical protein